MKTEYQLNIEKMMEAQTDKGLHKYGVTLADNTTLTTEQRIEHFQEEAIDALFYGEHLKAALRDEGLTANDYQRAAMRTAPDSIGAEEMLLNSFFGLQGELGELFDLYKKHRYQGHPLDPEDMKLELGDLLWYAAEMATALGFTLSEVMTANIEKLKARYPEGFDKARSIHREA